jgi:hypothetical protein
MANISLWTRVIVEQSQTQTLAALKGITASAYGVENGVFAFVPGLGLFQYEPASSATGDDINVVQPTSGTGRWIRLTQAAPTVNPSGQLLISNIALGLYEVTVNGDGSGDFTEVNLAMSAGFFRIVVTGNTIETNSFVFEDTQYDVNITILPGVKIDCQALNNVYDASTNGALVNFVVAGQGNPLRSGFVWSPTVESTFFNFTAAQPGSRVELNYSYIDTSAAVASDYHAFVGGTEVSFFCEKPAIALSNATTSFIEGYNIFIDTPLLLGGGTNCASIVNCPNANICIIKFPIFINQFSSTTPVLSASNFTLEGAYNSSAGNLLINGINMTVIGVKELIGGISFDFNADGYSTFDNCYLPNGTVFLSSTLTYTSLNSSVFADLDESANPTTGEFNACNVSFTQSQDFGTAEKVTWNLTNVNVFADAQISGRDVTWNGGAIGSSTAPHNLTINAGALNALVTNVRTDAAITNNEPSAILGFNPFFS